ncbi:MAG: hypothetical protein KA419_13750 [Acidobacteria bacterium]|nr:hypothetical protein [Acidobacteriota bacterium]
MSEKKSADDLIREALEAEGVKDLELSGEPGMQDLVTGIFRGRMWWAGIIMTANLLACAALAVFCGVKFFGAAEVPVMLRWGAGFFLFVILTVGCKLWYWARLERLAVTREIKRVELLLAHLAAELRDRQ